VSAEAIADALLRVDGVTAVVAQRIALEQLPQGSDYPAIVYRTISTTPIENLCSPSAASVSRLQVNPMAATMGEVNALHEVVRAALESDAQRTAAGRRVIGCRFAGFGPVSKDEFTGVWTKSADYTLMHE